MQLWWWAVGSYSSCVFVAIFFLVGRFSVTQKRKNAIGSNVEDSKWFAAHEEDPCSLPFFFLSKYLICS